VKSTRDHSVPHENS